MDFSGLHCYLCFCFPSNQRKMCITNCGHTFCDRCVTDVSSHTCCRYCRKSCLTVVFQLGSNYELGLYFRPIASELAKIETFKLANFKHLIDGFYRQASRAIQDHQKCKAELDAIKRELDELKMKLAQNEQEKQALTQRFSQELNKSNQELAELKRKHEMLTNNIRSGGLNRPPRVPSGPQTPRVNNNHIQSSERAASIAQSNSVQRQRHSNSFFNLNETPNVANTPTVFNFNAMVTSNVTSNGQQQRQSNSMKQQFGVKRTPNAFPSTPSFAPSNYTPLSHSSLTNNIGSRMHTILTSSPNTPIANKVAIPSRNFRYSNPSKIGRITPYSPHGKIMK